ncbi:DNA repair protein RecN [Rhodoferax sp.]|uniref:DNA repair protein RecN n=1 Tax=Rhodoferax sp. TaxID=50421 RepID=UPI002845351E|nr:DNA repair protein RecN [Rhodoferax sp.]MDR3371197.1 DNA repair protein RecN [Rhodoferax sp.]
MSLKRIVLRDFVIVSELDLDLASGFTVLTGETGAGKSILVDALQLVTGGRADVTVIREGASRTDVSAEFEATPAIADWLEDAGFESDHSLLLRRTIDTQGKSRAWINGSPATATQLRALGEQLLDIHGQHAWQSLTRPEAVRGLLDAYAKVTTSAAVARWQIWRAAQDKFAQARASQDSLLSERERLNWQIGELDKLNPARDEWPTLNAEHTRLSNAQALLDAAQSALLTLDENEDNACGLTGSACEALQKHEHIEPIFKGLSDVLSSSLAQLEDAVHSLRAYLRKTELDPDRLTALDERMGLWVSLARRYKRSPEELVDLLSGWKQQLQALDTAADLQALECELESAWQGYLQEANKLTQARKKSAPKLAQTITQAMQGLGMQGGQFEVQIQAAGQPLQTGLEEVNFLVAGHAGSTPRPVNKVASGGELSRLALAIAVTTSQLGTAQTLIFDEVDAGVGGAVAETVGRLMRQLGIDRQVLAVTHLPQVAACADHHLVVSKQLTGTSTVSSVVSVNGEERVTELARMLGGERILASTLTHARDMLQIQGSLT